MDVVNFGQPEKTNENQTYSSTTSHKPNKLRSHRKSQSHPHLEVCVWTYPHSPHRPMIHGFELTDIIKSLDLGLEIAFSCRRVHDDVGTRIFANNMFNKIIVICGGKYPGSCSVVAVSLVFQNNAGHASSNRPFGPRGFLRYWLAVAARPETFCGLPCCCNSFADRGNAYMICWLVVLVVYLPL